MRRRRLCAGGEFERSSPTAQSDVEVNEVVPATHDAVEAIPWEDMWLRRTDLRRCTLIADTMRAAHVVMVVHVLRVEAARAHANHGSCPCLQPSSLVQVMALVQEVTCDLHLTEAERVTR